MAETTPACAEPAATDSPITVKAFHISDDDEWRELGGYLDNVIARAALAEILTRKLDEAPTYSTRITWRNDIHHLSLGERNGVWLGDDQYLLDNPQARVDAGMSRKCPRCREMVDDSRWANQPCARCVVEDLGPDELEAMRQRLAAFEALADDVRSWDAKRDRISHKENHEGGAYDEWHGSDDGAVDIVRKLQALLGPAAEAAPVRYCENCENCRDVE